MLPSDAGGDVVGNVEDTTADEEDEDDDEEIEDVATQPLTVRGLSWGYSFFQFTCL